MTEQWLSRLADYGALGLMLGLVTIALWKVAAVALTFFQERLAKADEQQHARDEFSRERMAFYETGIIKALADLASANMVHDQKSAEAHRQQQESLGRIEHNTERRGP